MVVQMLLARGVEWHVAASNRASRREPCLAAMASARRSFNITTMLRVYAAWPAACKHKMQCNLYYLTTLYLVI
jgi:hypothetical protein